MLIMELHQIKKYYGDRLLLNVDGLKIYSGDKIGLIGLNGAGKTTLLEIIAGALPADEGHVKFYGPWAYITQLDADDAGYQSGGEKTLAKIDEAFGQEPLLVMADEPTSNLSIGHVEMLTERFRSFHGALLLISHDRALLNETCNRIIEIDEGQIKEYAGNYDFYRKEKDIADRQKQLDYEKYVQERDRLTEAVASIKQKAKGMKKAPTRMGNSEARLHKNGIKERAKKVAGTSRAIEARLEKLEEVKKPIIHARTKIDIQESKRIYAKLALEVTGLSKSFDTPTGNAAPGRVLFKDASFKIVTGSKTALIGENGTGKTTLVKMILDGQDGVKKANRLEIAYFSQDLSILDQNKTIYDSVAEDSALTQTQIRNILSRMLFFRDDVFKKVAVLSGGERVKVALAKLFCRNVNMLILDEPNNYLDIYSMEALEGLIADYEGTILLVTHDRSLLRLADRLLLIEGGEIISINDSYSAYMSRRDSLPATSETGGTGTPQPVVGKNAILQMEHQLAEIIGRLSTPGQKAEEIDRLDRAFHSLSAALRQAKG